MSAGERLEQYLSEVRQRLQAVVVARASAVIAATALLVTILAVLVLRDPGFPSRGMLVARVVLVLALATGAVAMLWRPLNALRARNRARTLERHLPAQKGRIETYLELARRRDAGLDAPLIDLLAEDALVLADDTPVSEVVPPRRLWVPVTAAILGVVVLALMLALGSGEWGFGSRNLWFGTPIPREQIALRQIAVTPGDATVRRNQDVPIRASVRGFRADRAEVFVRFADGKDWERAPMRAGDNGRFEFTLYAVREPLAYYVASNGTKSAEHHISIVDAPRIERMRLTYTYPSWTGLAPETDDVNRDIRAVAGTRVSVEVQTSAPLDSPMLTVNDSKSGLQSDGAWTRGTIDVEKPGHYRISARVGDELVALTDEHDISIVEDQQPTVEFAKPARDWQASSIEEVPVEVHARDDFRVQNVELHYSVNGGNWKVSPMKAGSKEVTGDTVLRLEEMGEPHLKPGDLVTYYAVARDRKQAVQTDLFLVHVQPFERRFTQGQAGGMQGGGAGDDQQNAISERQREILLATWNLKRQRERPDNREKERLEENARMLSEAQGTLADQARTLIDRAAARGVDTADPKNRELIENLQEAAKAMQPAAKDLGDIRLAEAIPSEQKALQHLLRAEALYTDIEVQFRNSMAGGGNGGQAGRDLAEMFELEMDLDKNQYETQSRAAGDQSSKQLEDALRKLRELAQRQERLAREAARQQQQPRESDRWKQEQLKRETEDLRKRLADLARQNASSNSSQGQGQGQSQSNSGGQSSSASTAQEALNQVEQALQNMQGEPGSQERGNPSSSGQPSGSQNARSAQLASRDLKQALEKLEQGRREGMAGTFDDLARRAQQMLAEQRRQENELLNAYSQSGNGAPNPAGPEQPGSGPFGPGRQRGLSWERAEALADQKRSLQSELDELQRDMQASAQQHREDAPDAAKRLGTAATDLAESSLSAGLARSAMELERGRGLQAATRERLITEAFENLANDLNQAARVAANEARQRRSEKDEASPEELLAELSELRRAWQQAQANALANSRNGLGPNGARDPNDPRNGLGVRDPRNGRDANDPRNALRGRDGTRLDPNDPRNPLSGRDGSRLDPDDPRNPLSARDGSRLDPNDPRNPLSARDAVRQGTAGSQRNQNSQSANGDQPGDSASPSAAGNESNGSSRLANANTGGYDWGGGADYGYRGPIFGPNRDRLAAWNPPLASGALRPGTEFRQQAEEISRRLRDMLNRMPQNALQPADISALRQLANRLRRAGADPMEAEYKNMQGLVDQLELAALNASEKTRAAAPTHTENPSVESPEYRETVAEYYRRLGGTK